MYLPQLTHEGGPAVVDGSGGARAVSGGNLEAGAGPGFGNSGRDKV